MARPNTYPKKTSFPAGAGFLGDSSAGVFFMEADPLVKNIGDALGTKALSRLRTETTLPTVTEVEGKQIGPSGTIIDNSTSNYSEFSVSGLDAVSIYAYGATTIASILFRDGEDNVVGDAISAISSGYNFFIENVPENAVKVQMCYSVYGGRTHDIKAWKFTDDVVAIKEYIDSDWTKNALGLKALSQIRTETTIDSPTVVDGKIVRVNGTIQDDMTTGQYTEFSVTGIDCVSIYSYASSAYASILFRDASNNVLGDPISASVSGFDFFFANVPENAVKVQMSYSTYAGRTHDIRAYKFTEDFEVIEDIYNHITEPYIEYKYTTIYPTEAGVYLFSDGSLSTAGGNLWKHTDKIPIDAGLKLIRLTNRITATILYTKFFNSLDQEITPRVGGVANTDGVAEFKVPEGAASVIISVIDYSSSYQNYCVEFGYEKIDKVNDNNGLNDCRFRDLADVTMIPIFGQSLSVGSASTPALSRIPKYKAGIQFNEGLLCPQKLASYFTEFMPLFERDLGQTVDSAGTGETVASGCCDKLLEIIQCEDGIGVHSELWNGKKFLFVCVGSGSKTIADLTNDYLQGFLNAVQGAKNICDANGKSLNVPCWIWIQGETDQKQHTTTSDYKAALLSLQSDIVSGVKSITGQTNDPKCITSQCGAQNIVLPSDMSPTYTTEAVDVPTAQMQVVRDSDDFSFACPSYILDHSSVEYIHLSNFGSRMMGLYFGKAVKAILDGKKFGGILPKTYTVSGNNLVIKCDVPCKPLMIDTEWVKEVSNYGFSVVNSGNTNILQSVEVFGDEITLHCSASPVGCMVYYGVDGTAYRDGRVQGARGNVRDSAGYVFSGSVGDDRICLHNWLPMFKSAISSNTGSID